ncbi:MAG: aminopeptidase P N-terminal domain-containing protein [Bacteroidota bacterium]
MRSAPISSALFLRNRSKLGKKMPGGAMAVVCSNPFMIRSGDQVYPYRQHSDFFYLTGIPQEGSVLVMTADSETLFIRKPDPKSDLWYGPLLTTDMASALSGIGDVRWAGEMDAFIEKGAKKAGMVYLNDPGAGGREYETETPDSRIQKKLAALVPGCKQNHLGPLLMQLRMVKEPEELEEIRKACAITCSGFHRVIKMLKPGVREYELEAGLTAEFIGKGAEGHAFDPIVASGKNALILHYIANKSTCRAGELLLVDFGAEVNNYASDCTRTLPVGGKFSYRQREIYNAVHRVFMHARALMVPGVTIGELHSLVGEAWEEEHLALGLYKRQEAASRPVSDPLWKRFFVHGTSHSMGLDVHDPMDRTVPFQPGMVLTCEPGIYIPEEGIGIRLENDILITENGPLDLLADIPMEAGEIEDLMLQKGQAWR